MNRFVDFFLVLCMMGCSEEQWPPTKMFAAVDVPAERASIHPWVAELLVSDVSVARKQLDDRFASDVPEIAPLTDMLNDYVPVQVVFSSRVGYLRCVRKFTDATNHQMGYDVMYLAQPLPGEALETRVAFFEREVQALARAFFARFAGSGEEMEGNAGQFTFHHWLSASEVSSNGENSYGDWRDAKLLYAAMNGDAVLIKSNGSTAWHTLETDEVTPIANTLQEFIKIYADFLKTHEAFDSWTYREHQSDRTKR